MRPFRGVLLLVVLLTVLGLGVLLAAIGLRHGGDAIGSKTTLVFDVPDDLREGETPARPFGLLGIARHRWYLHDVIAGLRRAARDDRVRALVLHVDGIDWGWAKTYEVREALQHFRAAGKPVYASLNGGGEIEYLLASGADVIATPPTSVLQLDGLTASAVFMGGALEKLAVRPNFARAGRYKSAVESYTRTGMSTESRAELEDLVADLYGLLVDSLSTARGLPAAEIRRLIDLGPYTSDDALRAGLVDTVLYDADADSLALDHADEDADFVDFGRYVDERTVFRGGPHLALITAAGTILPGRSRDAAGDDMVLGSQTMIDALAEARERRSIKAVVLRIDSPGGSIQASDDIWHEVKRLSDVKPVIVSMSDVAASGGYYIAAPVQHIVADPASITGSIGVFGGKFNLIGLLHKLGLNVETVSLGARAGMMSPYRDFTPDEQARYEQQIEKGYRLFLGRVAEGRGWSTAEVDSVAQGRVWSGRAAWEVGLVDTLGGLQSALAIAAEAGGLKDAERVPVEVLPRVEHRWYEALFEGLFDSGGGAATAPVLPPVVRAWIAASRLQAGVVLAMMPISLEIR